MKILSLTTFTIAALALNSTSYGVTHTLSGQMDVLQAGTNGGFGGGTGNGTGVISGDYDDVTDLLNYTITWQDLTSAVTNMHFHFGAPGVGGGVDLGIPGPWISPQVGAATLTDPNHEPRLLAGDWYVNVHTSNFGGGEIRGQVLVSVVPEPTTIGLALVAFLSTIALSRRR